MIKISPLPHTIDVVVSTIACICLTLTIILFSSFIGIKLNSTVQGIIASIVFVVFLSNLSAITLMSYEFLSLLVAIAMIVLVTIAGISMGRSIDKNEAL
ncbi:hypothetical protein [Secundilactobacillus kimchicus]|uniref:hypothetical protein n=1 Tax=Secundilactobacillus kimchicus TaxID=528209 RepID=UPI0006D0372D|nr:hypothetical protein [Secundilactobacillus kimchicus]